MTVNQNIKIKRREKNLTITYVADQIGISQSILSRYESGIIQFVPLTVIEKIAAVLECKPSDLTEGDQRYSQVQKKRVSSKNLSPEEYEMIINYRKLPENVQSLIKEVCFSHISISQ